MRTRRRHGYGGQFGYSGTFGDPEPDDQPPDMAGLLQDVTEHPGEDAPRLIFADYAEDAGRPDVARFIRGDPAFRFQAHHFWEWYFTPTLQEVFTGSPDCHVARLGDDQPPRWVVQVTGHVVTWTLVFRLGFVEKIILPRLDDWMKHGRNLVKEFPLLCVAQLDARPAEWTSTSPEGPRGAAGWWSDSVSEFVRGEGGLPFSLYAKLPDGMAQTYSADGKYWKWYADGKAAHDALSAACLELVRPTPCPRR